MAKALLTDGLVSALPAADACPTDLCVVGKLLTIPAFCLPVSAVKCAAFQILIEPFFHADHGGNVFLQQTKAVAAPAHTVGWIGDFGVGMVHMEERLCFRSGVRPGKRHLQDVERG